MKKTWIKPQTRSSSPKTETVKKDHAVGNDSYKMRPYSSEESLMNSSGRIPAQRKTSTPTHDCSTISLSSDISCILTNENKSNIAKKQQKGNVIRKTTIKEADIQETLDFEYTAYLQNSFRNKLEQSKCSDIDADLMNLQRRIAENEKILCQTKERLKNINFNKEVDLLHSLHNPNYGKVLETLDKSKCEEHLSALNQKLEQSHRQLRVKNIEVPHGGGAELAKVIADTSAAFEKLKTDNDVETPKVLAEIKKVNQNNRNLIKRSVNNLCTAENLLLTRTTLEISARNIHTPRDMLQSEDL